MSNPAAEPVAGANDIPRKRRHRGRKVVMALLVAPLMLSMAFAAHSHGFGVPASASVQTSPVLDESVPPAVYGDGLRRSVWTDGVSAVRQALAQPGYGAFAGSFVNVAAGNVVTFCGEVAGTSGYDSDSGARRFVSIFGQSQSTTLETLDPSFDVLWNRVCATASSAA